MKKRAEAWVTINSDGHALWYYPQKPGPRDVGGNRLVLLREVRPEDERELKALRKVERLALDAIETGAGVAVLLPALKAIAQARKQRRAAGRKA